MIEVRLRIERGIEKYGHVVIGVEPDPNGLVPAGYAYTIANNGVSFAVAGLRFDSARIILNAVVEKTREIDPGRLSGWSSKTIANAEVILASIDPEIAQKRLLLAAGRNEEPRAFAVHYPDAAGRWPDDPECDPTIRRLGTFWRIIPR